jgi:hypothetical protein
MARPSHQALPLWSPATSKSNIASRPGITVSGRIGFWGGCRINPERGSGQEMMVKHQMQPRDEYR